MKEERTEWPMSVTCSEWLLRTWTYISLFSFFFNFHIVFIWDHHLRSYKSYHTRTVVYRSLRCMRLGTCLWLRDWGLETDILPTSGSLCPLVIRNCLPIFRVSLSYKNQYGGYGDFLNTSRMTSRTETSSRQQNVFLCVSIPWPESSTLFLPTQVVDT